MRRTCKTCGLIFVTNKDNKLKVCYKCFIAQVEEDFTMVSPCLYEMSTKMLDDMRGLTNLMLAYIKAELASRRTYLEKLQIRIGG